MWDTVEHIADGRCCFGYGHAGLACDFLAKKSVRDVSDLLCRRIVAEQSDQLLTRRKFHFRTDMKAVEGVLPVHFPHDESGSVSLIAFQCPASDGWVGNDLHDFRDDGLTTELAVGITLAVDASGA